jgi:hypothetical protein
MCLGISALAASLVSLSAPTSANRTVELPVLFVHELAKKNKALTKKRDAAFII